MHVCGFNRICGFAILTLWGGESAISRNGDIYNRSQTGSVSEFPPKARGVRARVRARMRDTQGQGEIT